MPLRITLRPGEKLVVGNAVISNGPREADFSIEGTNVPILRERQVMRPADADTPCKQLYLAVQLLYLRDGDYFELSDHLMRLAEEICRAAPSLAPFVADVSTLVMAGDHYKALRRCEALIAAEAEILALVAPAGDERVH